MEQIFFGGTLVVIVLAALLLLVVARFIPIGLWITAFASGVRLSFLNLFGMRFRRVDPRQIVLPLIAATKAGLQLNVNELEGHYLAGGDVGRVVTFGTERVDAALGVHFHNDAGCAVASSLAAVEAALIDRVGSRIRCRESIGTSVRFSSRYSPRTR